MRRRVVIGLAPVGIVAPAFCPPARADVTAEQVRQAIDRGVAYLKREQRKDGSWPEHPTLAGGMTALATLALLNPACRPTIRRFARRSPSCARFRRNSITSFACRRWSSAPPTRRPTRC